MIQEVLILRSFSLSIRFFIVTFILLPRKASCLDPQYLACYPKSCGKGPDVSFPFYIQDQQESFCGYPGFNLSCNDHNELILKLSDSDYIVQQIFYELKSLRVSNAAFSDYTICDSPIQNLSLPDDRFRLSPGYEDILLLFNCNSTIVDTNLTFAYSNVCPYPSKSVVSIYAIFKDNPWSVFASEICTYGAVAPVQSGKGNISVDLLQSGFSLNWIASNCSTCQISGGKCGYDEITHQFRCFCPDRPYAWSCSSGIDKAFFAAHKVIMASIGASVAGIGILLLIVYNIRRQFSSKKQTRDNQNIEAIMKNHGSLSSKRYKYSEVKKMTNAFKDKLGQGGYGSVYKGTLPDGRVVAVKLLKGSESNGEDFINEVTSISRTSHVNIVTLLGFCFEGPKRALIYEFMPNGSLEKYIYEENPSNSERRLGWETLHQIAIGIARGLEYLHRGCNTRILHFDIKPHNILLDESFHPKISDFGLAKICLKKESNVSMSMLGARGTAGYIAPEVFFRNFGGVSHKSDVYSYGMLVLEMVGARKNNCVEVDHSSEIYFPHWICKRLEHGKELGLNGINNEKEDRIARKMILVSLWCIQTDPPNRPPMWRVVELLQGSLGTLPMPPRPTLSSPPRFPPRSSLEDSATASTSMTKSSQE